MNEERIVCELKAGNYTVFKEIVELFKNRIFGMAYKFTNNYDEAQDLSQEIFLKVYKEISGFRFESKLSTWIYRISINTCLDWKRKNSKVKILSTSIINDDDETIDIDIRDDNPLPDEAFIRSENQREVHKLVHGLPDKYKTVIIMYHFNSMSYQDISTALNVPERTVETRLYRARRLLKDELTKLNDRGGYKWNAKKS
ncbi:sigma-70 family RNA polymerase sigma factor [Proteiniborus sp. MB09-C3]|uniref:RNA polymerase sigma factor n=1 Tax=Proteiniborus sp. MB09-C3 TaxID=3050072 RepID=UPI002554E136|nr:sigma-70 family RNA polymerase sigma factor [Proteiniborus sp. MB09-C3]WIV11393.1 sigma-70 family RNA polymerase sigma factor [Proteiniborus sp. MB09-C3]